MHETSETAEELEYSGTHTIDFRQVILRMLLTPEEMLNTRDMNQARFTISLIVFPLC